MKPRLTTYFILLPLIFLIATLPVDLILKYLSWILIPLCCITTLGALYVLYQRTHLKKCLVILSILLSMSCLSTVPVCAQTVEDCEKAYNEATADILSKPVDQQTDAEKNKVLEARQELTDCTRDAQTQDKPCQTPAELLKETMQDCWVCDLTYVIIEVMDNIATVFYRKVLDPDNGANIPLMLLGLGFGFWILVRTLALLTTFGMGDIGSYFTDFFKRFLVVMIAAILLQAPMITAVNYFITPVFLFSSGFTSSFAGNNGSSGHSNNFNVQMSNRLNVHVSYRYGGSTATGGCSYCEHLSEPQATVSNPYVSLIRKYFGIYTTQDRAVSQTLKNSMLCTACSIYSITAPPMVIGQYLVCAATNKPQTTRIPFFVTLPNFGMLFTGIILVVSFFLISGFFPFFLIDVFFRVSFVLILLPFLIVAFAFQSTREYTKRAFNVLLFALFTFITLSVLLRVIMEMFYSLFDTVV